MTTNTKYFSGETELIHTFGIPWQEFLDIGGKPNKHNRYDSFKRLAGYAANDKTLLPVTRTIYYKTNPSLHKCGARCQSATGHNCECACGGKHHGINA